MAVIEFTKLITDFEQALITIALSRTHGNQAHAARMLGINRTTLVEKANKYGIKSYCDARFAAVKEYERVKRVQKVLRTIERCETDVAIDRVDNFARALRDRRSALQDEEGRDVHMKQVLEKVYESSPT